MNSVKIPIISLGEDLLISFQGDIKDEQLTELKSDLFEELSAKDIRGAILDVSGLSTMDSFMARSINELAKGAQLNGVQTFLVGIRSEVAMTLVQMGLSIPEIEAEQTVGQALDELESLSAGN